MNWSYLAGFIDGEGSIIMGKHGTVSVSISNTNRVVLEEIKNFLGFGSVRFSESRNPGVWAPSGVYKSGDHNDVLYILVHIKHHLIIKKQKAIDAIEFIKTKQWFEPKEYNLKQLLKLRFEKGYSFRKIGVIMGVNRQTLRNYMEKKGYDPKIKLHSNQYNSSLNQ